MIGPSVSTGCVLFQWIVHTTANFEGQMARCTASGDSTPFFVSPARVNERGSLFTVWIAKKVNGQDPVLTTRWDGGVLVH